MVKMRLAVFALMLVPSLAHSQHIVATSTLGSPVPEHADREAGWNGHVDYVQWAGDNILCGGRSGFVRCYDPKTKQPKWSVQLGGEIDCISVAIPKDRLYVLDNQNAVHVFRVSDGHKAATVSSNQLARNAGRSFLTPGRVGWIPFVDQLFVTNFSEKYGDNGFLFDATNFKKAATIKCDGFVSEIATTPDGRFIVTRNWSNIRIWDAKEGKEIFKYGDDKEVAIDAPFVSNATFDGEHTMVYTVDNSWATGKVFVHDILANKETASFDSRNGHVVMDVDFPHGRIALTGTKQNLTVVDLTGKVVANKQAVTFQRNVAIAFSPDGKRLAIGSWDNTVRVFELRGGASN